MLTLQESWRPSTQLVRPVDATDRTGYRPVISSHITKAQEARIPSPAYKGRWASIGWLVGWLAVVADVREPFVSIDASPTTDANVSYLTVCLTHLSTHSGLPNAACLNPGTSSKNASKKPGTPTYRCPSSSFSTSSTCLRYSVEFAKLLVLMERGVCWKDEVGRGRRAIRRSTMSKAHARSSGRVEVVQIRNWPLRSAGRGRGRCSYWLDAAGFFVRCNLVRLGTGDQACRKDSPCALVVLNLTLACICQKGSSRSDRERE